MIIYNHDLTNLRLNANYNRYNRLNRNVSNRQGMNEYLSLSEFIELREPLSKANLLDNPHTIKALMPHVKRLKYAEIVAHLKTMGYTIKKNKYTQTTATQTYKIVSFMYENNVYFNSITLDEIREGYLKRLF